ncbi:MAG: AAA-like domain-containing protein [Spirulinaceae cyanobacterium]
MGYAIQGRLDSENQHPLLKDITVNRIEPLLNIFRRILGFTFSEPSIMMNTEFPDSPVPLDSPLYVQRPPIEEQAYREIQKPGSLLRIKAPKRMGKSSLLIRILDQANKQSYDTISVDFQEADIAIYQDIQTFLRWFCANVARQLELESRLDEFWDEEVGSKVSTTFYFENYLLKDLTKPVVLTLNEVNQVFEYPKIAQDFLPLLRFWYEQAKVRQRFKNLRLVVIHSTEIYVPLNLNHSPFNVGFSLELSYFNAQQVQALAQRHELHWFDSESTQELMKMVGGHPYLVRIALYHLQQGKVSLAQILKDAPTQSGIYHDHLQNHWETLCEQPQLGVAIQRLLTEPDDVKFEPSVAYKLKSMGLVKVKGDVCQFSCHLYFLYFLAQHSEAQQQIATYVPVYEEED